MEDMGRLPIVMEELLERADFPQASTKDRSFFPQTHDRLGKEAVQKMSEENVKSQRGQKASFVVHILHRQNATWQGKVTWMEKDRSQNFRSALELLKLIDDALTQNEENEGSDGSK